jgi:hypothetical protein
VLKECDLNQNLDSALSIIWNELKYKAIITRQYAADLPLVTCYPGKGSIDVQSELGIGTTFMIRIPVKGPASEEARI